MRAWPLLCLALAACGGAGGNNAATTDQIERLSTPDNGVEAVSASARLAPLQVADIGDGRGCRFAREGRILFYATGEDAVARLSGALRHFASTAPAAPTGGFFEDRQISISIGRTDDGDRLTVTNRRTEVQEQLRGVWRCGGRQ